MTSSMMPAALYLHIPFCVKKCDYCDFYSLPGAQPELLERYTNALIQEIMQERPEWNDQVFETVFLGGGTPSLLLPSQVGRILEAVFANFRFICEQPEISMEANPATLYAAKLQELKDAGINRLSIGAQSFLDRELQILGRIHGAEELRETLHMINNSPIENINLDLIYGIPGQTLDDWKFSMNQALQSNVKHLSAYLLQLESNTPMCTKIEKGLLTQPGDDLQADMYETAIDLLSSHGLHQYEISNFARPGYECKHNLMYWKSADYLGLGPGAVSLRGEQRRLNKPSALEYMDSLEKGQQPAVEVLEQMSSEQRLSEAIVMGLRMLEGINCTALSERFGVDVLEIFRDEFKHCLDLGLLGKENEQIYLTRPAYFISNEVFCRFIR